MRILKDLITKLEDKSKEEKITKKLIESTFEKVKFKDEGYFVFCQKKDKKTVKDKISGEIKEMNEEGLGGIIVVSKDGKTIVDNSYATRISVINDQFISDINKIFFNKVSLK
ncbi:V-type H+-transporting ATPase subunit E [Nosema bombycis CQ1]|uniref:V-type H+-transporting ATPase subunit E n=1 Tax=Nosema bombycis (strain CQ1 / CVCC 102059) TaxID=578461 RepID=R0MHZ6_NOSB1|nr:V-type H+-transporting ATPase subunit E [Nosema bombycis CQ1]|eukprot:EOB13775.1 V-type H+-transporting ATPase subunit E [Nosema bombycis CQ1]